MTRRKRRILLGVVVFPMVLILAPHLFSRAASSSRAVSIIEYGPATTESRDVLRLMTWNIAHGRGDALDACNWTRGDPAAAQRLVDIAATIRDANADVVVLNEVDFAAVWSGHVDQAATIARLAGYPYLVTQRNYDIAIPFVAVRFGNAILSRHRVIEAERIDLPPRSRLEDWLAGNHDALRVRIETDAFGAIDVIGVHLEVRDEGTRRGAAHTLNTIVGTSSTPTIIAGDFNSYPSDTFVTANAIDLFYETNLFDTTPPFDAGVPTLPKKPKLGTIDWILTPVEWDVTGRVGTSTLSDHAPVIAEARLPTR